MAPECQRHNFHLPSTAFDCAPMFPALHPVSLISHSTSTDIQRLSNMPACSAQATMSIEQQKEILILNFPRDVSPNNICVWFCSAKLVPHSIKLKLCLVDFNRSEHAARRLCCVVVLAWRSFRREKRAYLFFLKIVTLCVKSDLRFHFHLHPPLAHINLFYCWLFLVRLIRLSSPEKSFQWKLKKVEFSFFIPPG